MLTPVGRWGGYVMRMVASELNSDYRVFTWDRSNSDGGSSVMVNREVSEAEIWAD